MATRLQARRAVVELLYASELGNEWTLEGATPYLNSSKIKNKQQAFALSLLSGVRDHEGVILCIMKIFVKDWDLGRLGVLEKSILKLGIFELLETDTNRVVVINEALELAKIFNDEALGLINGVLDSVSKISKDELLRLANEELAAQAAAKEAMQKEAMEKAAKEAMQSPKMPRDSKTKPQKKNTKSRAKPSNKKQGNKHEASPSPRPTKQRRESSPTKRSRPSPKN